MTMSYTIDVKENGFEITNMNTEKTFVIPNHNSFESES